MGGWFFPGRRGLIILLILILIFWFPGIFGFEEEK